MVKPTISLIITNRNGAKFLIRCLGSIFVDKGDYEVILIDDGSNDSSIEIIKTCFGKNVKLNLVVLKNNVGAAAARNLGVKKSTGKYLMFLDADTKIKQGWFRETIRFFEENRKVGAAQVKLLTMNTKKYDYAGDFMGSFGFLIERARGATDTGQFDEITSIFSGKSAGMIIRRIVFEKLGGFDEGYQIFLEDTDLFWRTWLAGYKVLFVPTIVVWHAYWTDEKPFSHYVDNQVFYRGCRNMISTQIKNFGIVRLCWNLPLVICTWLILAVVFLIKGKPERFFALTKGVAWNIVNLKTTLTKRLKIQKSRKISDNELFTIVGTSRDLGYYLGKLRAYTSGESF